MHGGWFLALYIDLQLTWMGLESYLWTNTTYGYKKSKKRELVLHLELEALFWVMDSILHHQKCQHFRKDYNDLIELIKGTSCTTFSTQLTETQEVKRRFNGFRLSYIFQGQNETADFLVRISRSFHKVLCFVCYFIPI